MSKNIETLIEKSMINKINEFEQSIMKNNKFNDPYELNNLILQRHFLIKTFKEINKELKKDNRQFRIDFDNNAYDYFDEQNYYYLKYKGCITDNDELLYFKVREELYALDLLIKNLLFLICIHKMSIHMSIKEYMKDLNTLKPEHDLLTIYTNINELFNLLKEFIKTNLLKKSITKESNLKKKIESIKSTIKSALLTYNEPIYSSDEEDKGS